MAEPVWERLLIGADAATMTECGGDPWGRIEDAAVGIAKGRIVWVGARRDLPAAPAALAREVVDLGGGWLTPALVDCHTHLIFAGDRANEFEMRLAGRSYEEIAAAGGGILSTVRATRAADEAALLETALRRLDAMIADGLATIEIKSGYGLDVENELKMLRVARRLGELRPVRVRTTLLAAHALPPEHAGDRAGYLRLVTDEMIPRAVAEGLADAVDVFVERIAFTADEAERVLAAARAHGLAVKVHAEQLSNAQGARLAARMKALSADHLEHLDDEGIAAMARAGTVAVLLPGAFHFLGETRTPPVARLRAAGVPIAIASDCNPGSSPLLSPRLAMHLACTAFGLAPAEALAGMTREGARALGLGGEIGVIAPGRRADLAHWRIGHPAELACWMGGDLLARRWYDGREREEGEDG